MGFAINLGVNMSERSVKLIMIYSENACYGTQTRYLASDCY